MRVLLALVVCVGCGRRGMDALDDAPLGPSDATCGGAHLDLSYVAPNLGLVIDRSCSMQKDLAGTTTSKWSAGVGAITHALATFGARIRWGATLFPSITGQACAQDHSQVPIADGNDTTIASLLTAALDPTNALYPKGPCVTNIDTGLARAAVDPALGDVARTSYLMLVTDGGQASCNAGGGNTGSLATVGQLHAGGVDTFVVGFGSEVDATFLNQLADAGGRALTGATRYYQADTASAIDQVYQSIAATVASCTYHVAPPPPDLNETWVLFDHTLVPRDPSHGDGWDYDATTQTLTFYGAPCGELQGQQVMAIDVVFGCPTPPIV